MDILNFNPSQLSAFNDEQKTSRASNPMIYKTKPDESKSSDGVYRSTIRVIYNPFDLKHSILEQVSYSMTDKDGWFSAVSSLTNGDTNCPIFKAWKKCHYEKENAALHNQAETKANGGKGLFDRRTSRYVTIQVIEDKNHPELEGNYMFWKMPVAIWKKIQNKMNPAEDSGKAPIPIMDFLMGRAIELEVTPGPDDPKAPTRKTREISYDTSEVTDEIISCTNPDKSPILNDEQQDICDRYIKMMKPVWKERDAEKRIKLIEEINQDSNTKEFSRIYSEEVLPTIKGFCPNLIDELGYKPWGEELTKRVSNWIDVVLACKDPSVDSLVSTTQTSNTNDSANSNNETTESNVNKGSESESSFTADVSPSVDDLPF